MMLLRTCLALAALLLATAPLGAQYTSFRRYDGGTFSVEMPAYIRGLERLHQQELAGQRFEFFGGGHVEQSVVMVMRATPARFSTDTAGMRTHLARVMTDTALMTRYLQALADSTHPEHADIVRTLSDTTLAGRRLFLRRFRRPWITANPPSWIVIRGNPREIVSDERIVLRSPVTLRMGEGLPDLYGTVDVVIQRRGEMIVWMVAHASRDRSPEFDAATERILDSFRVSSQP